ncbi:MAG: hypothetical protein KDE68_02520 [Rhodocyclaceae bacterium]|nr:hypothetical protein [Rhodocyclaceae bacterium]
MSRLPTFLGIGAPKCGTTWLAECLLEYPQVCVPEVKEVVYFSSAKKLERGDAWYLAHFDPAGDAKAVGEFSVTYHAGGADVAARIQALAPEVHVLAVLRDPVERAFSHYRWLCQLGKLDEGTSFAEAMRLRPEIVEDSLYFKVLSSYLKRLRVHIYRFSRRNGPNGLISFVKRSGLSALYRDINNKQSKQLSLDAAADAEAFGLFREDVLKLQAATGFDCTKWLEKGSRF